MNITLDEILNIVGNPIRRKILQKLSRESHYPLQLSKELNVSQQAIMKHLKVLEQLDLVKSHREKSVTGPPRKYYDPTARFSLIIDLGTNTFNARLYQLKDDDPAKRPCIEEIEQLIDEHETVRRLNNNHDRFLELSELIEKINSKLRGIEKDRNALLLLRSEVMKEAQRIISALTDNYEHRSLLYYLLEKDDRTISTISEQMDLRIKLIEKWIEELSDLDLPIGQLLQEYDRPKSSNDQTRTG